jgi:putative membrane-bound dehydrogenase-like protein
MTSGEGLWRRVLVLMGAGSFRAQGVRQKSRWEIWTVSLAVIAIWWSLEGSNVTAAEFVLNGQRFTVPEGFEVELAAGTNLLLRPVSASFDDQGRLYVTESSGSNETPQKQLANPTHRVLRLEDADGDGRFDKVGVFADKVMFPEGCLWHEGSVYVAGPPSIWRFTDTNNDGVADAREEWFKGGTLTGCANDIHGPFLGPDGYLYWTKGAFAEQSHPLANGRVLKDRAAHIYRARPDGSDLDVIMSGGMDNPVEIAFTSEGEAIFTCTFIDLSQPGLRDGIGHAIYGGVFGKENDVLEDGHVPRTSPDVFHPFYQAGSAAECALCRYSSDIFGAGYRDNFFATSFNLHKVTRHQLRLNGASYASETSDFLVSDSIDFHPTGILPDADGSLLVVDTGGWYKLCCPSSQLAKPDVPGAIYRIRRAGAPRLSPEQRKAAYSQLKHAPSMADYTIVATLKRAAWKNDPKNAGWLREMLQKNAALARTNAASAHVVRVAAEGLGRIRDKESVPAILGAVSEVGQTDNFILHSLIFALIEIAAPEMTRAGLAAGSLAAQRAALIALDQMPDGNLRPDEAMRFLKVRDESLRKAAIWVFHHHPDWAGAAEELAAGILGPSADGKLSREEKFALLRLLATAPAVQTKIAARIAIAPLDEKTSLFTAVAESGARTFSSEWIATIGHALERPENQIAGEAIKAAHAVGGDRKSPPPELLTLRPALLAFAEDPNRPAELRLEALLASGANVSPTSEPLLDLAVSSLASSKPPALRAQALQVLQKFKFDSTGLLKVADAIPGVSPLELGGALTVFNQNSGEEVGRKLLSALSKSSARSSLSPGAVRDLFAHYPQAVQAEATEFIQRLNQDAITQAAHLDSLLEQVKALPGDIRRGQAIFNSPKALCTTCHKVGYLGGNVGPDLTSIGQARTERDLLESIVYPSASFARGYEPRIVATKSGEQINGVIRRDAPEELVLATGPNAEVRLARSEIADMRPGTISIMPQGLDEQLSRQELSDLLAFLKNTRWGPQ